MANQAVTQNGDSISHSPMVRPPQQNRRRAPSRDRGRLLLPEPKVGSIPQIPRFPALVVGEITVIGLKLVVGGNPSVWWPPVLPGKAEDQQVGREGFVRATDSEVGGSIHGIQQGICLNTSGAQAENIREDGYATCFSLLGVVESVELVLGPWGVINERYCGPYPCRKRPALKCDFPQERCTVC